MKIVFSLISSGISIEPFELTPNIRVNAVAPGGTITALTIIPPLPTFTKSVDNDTKASNIKRKKSTSTCTNA